MIDQKPKDTTFRQCSHGSPLCKPCSNKRVIEWIDVNDKLPNHNQKILVFCENENNYEFCIFFDSQKMNFVMLTTGHKIIIDIEKEPYSFYNQKTKERILNVKFWADISNLNPKI
jgi:hypothetical protein